jgi:hypothetical protein
MSTDAGNPFVEFLNRYTTVSSNHEAAFDEYISQDEGRYVEPESALQLETTTEKYVRERFKEGKPVSIILTGNAGDGKTYLCRKIIEEFAGRKIKQWSEDDLDYSLTENGHTLRVVKDISEVNEKHGGEILTDLNETLASDEANTFFLVAANEGRLRAILSDRNLNPLEERVGQQLREGPDPEADDLVVLNLNDVATSNYVPQVLKWIGDEGHWSACEGCPAIESCPIRYNGLRLKDSPISERLQLFYKVLEHLDFHATIRDMLIHLAFTATGGLRCEEVIDRHSDLEWEPESYAYYENALGESASETFKEKSAVVSRLQALNPGNESIFELDDLIINGVSGAENNSADKEHWEELFGDPSLDLGFRRFNQSREAYLFGDTAQDTGEDAANLLHWLPHLRRKLLFEWKREEDVLSLFPFLYLEDYIKLLRRQASPKRYRDKLILGLNRAFSGLFLSDSHSLYVTSHYARAAEQSVPVVRLSLPKMNVRLERIHRGSRALDQDYHLLRLTIAPPPYSDASAPVEWPIDLLQFEYLLRRADGSTPNILSAECDLSVRRLRDRLVSAFEDGRSRSAVEFFAESNGKYETRTLDISNGTKIEAR